MMKRCALAVVVWTLSTAPAWADSYQLVDLILPGATGSSVAGVDAAGEAAGTATLADGTTRAFLYSGGRVADIGLLRGADSMAATAIGGGGQVVGTATYADGSTHAFYYTAGGGLLDLGTLPGAASSTAVAANAAGQAVGSSGGHGVFYSNGGPVDLGAGVTPLAINDAGRVVGNANGHAFYSDKGGARVDLPPLSGGSSSADGVNALGHVLVQSGSRLYYTNSAGGQVEIKDTSGVGYTLTGKAINDRDQALVQAAGVSNTSALVLYSGGSLTPLINPLAGRFIFAGALNNGGQVAATAVDSGFRGHAYLFNAQGKAFSIDGLAGYPRSFQSFDSASGLNDAGSVVGLGTAADGSTHGYLLLASVPTPPALAMLVPGLAGALGLLRRTTRR